MEVPALGGEAGPPSGLGTLASHKHLDKAPGPCLHLYIIMKMQMSRSNQKLAERIGPDSNFCGRFCDQKTPCMEVPYCIQEELMPPHSCS